MTNRVTVATRPRINTQKIIVLFKFPNTSADVIKAISLANNFVSERLLQVIEFPNFLDGFAVIVLRLVFERAVKQAC